MFGKSCKNAPVVKCAWSPFCPCLACFSLEKEEQSKECIKVLHSPKSDRVNRDLLLPAPPIEDLKKKYSPKCSFNILWLTWEVSCVIHGECTFLQPNLWEENPSIVVTYCDFSIGSESSLEPGKSVRSLPCSGVLCLRLSLLGSGDCRWAHQPLGLTQNRNICVFSSSLPVSEHFHKFSSNQSLFWATRIIMIVI